MDLNWIKSEVFYVLYVFWNKSSVSAVIRFRREVLSPKFKSISIRTFSISDQIFMVHFGHFCIPLFFFLFILRDTFWVFHTVQEWLSVLVFVESVELMEIYCSTDDTNEGGDDAYSCLYRGASIECVS